MKKLLLAVAILAVSVSAQASALTNNVGACGLGNIIWNDAAKLGDKGWLIQTMALTTNMWFFNQGFSITTGTMGCSGSLNKVVDADVVDFVSGNMDSLAKDIAKGSGETIETLATMLEVADVDAYGATLQANFAYIYPTSDVQSSDVASKVVELL